MVGLVVATGALPSPKSKTYLTIVSRSCGSVDEASGSKEREASKWMLRFFRGPIDDAERTGTGAWFGPHWDTGTVCTEPAPMPLSGIRSRGCERTTASFEEMASSDVMLWPAAVTPMSLARTTIVIRPVAGA